MIGDQMAASCIELCIELFTCSTSASAFGVFSASNASPGKDRAAHTLNALERQSEELERGALEKHPEEFVF